MKFSYHLFLICLLSFISCSSPTSQENNEETEPQTPQWQSLFNGENLDGWQIRIKGFEISENYANTFSVQDSILRISYDGYESYDDKFGALYTTNSYSNYRLKVEYRFVGETAPGAPEWGFRDSGIQYHCQSAESMNPEQPFPVSLEYNLHGGDGENERPVGQICAIGTYVHLNGERSESFCTQPEVKRTFHGDQWVLAEIEVKGDTISQWVNGEKIIEFTDPRINPEDEWGKTLIKDGDNKLRSGHISLQSNSHPIEFRKIEILEY